MAPKKGKTAANTTATKKLPSPKKGGGEKSTSGRDASPTELPSPTESVGPIWDSPLRSLPDAVKSVVDNGPLPGLDATPIHFRNPKNYCYRNALMTMMMYTPQLLAYVRDWHMQMEFPDYPYLDHIMQAFDNVAQAYHTLSSTRVRATEAAMFALWKLFRGSPSSVASFAGALPEPDDALQEDSSELLGLMLDEIERQLNEGGISDDEDESESIFEAMLKTSVTYRSRCPGTQDDICTKPNEK